VRSRIRVQSEDRRGVNYVGGIRIWYAKQNFSKKFLLQEDSFTFEILVKIFYWKYESIEMGTRTTRYHNHIILMQFLSEYRLFLIGQCFWGSDNFPAPCHFINIHYAYYRNDSCELRFRILYVSANQIVEMTITELPASDFTGMCLDLSFISWRRTLLTI